MKVCVLGAGGMLGHMLVRSLSESHDIYGTTRESPNDSSLLAKFLSKNCWIGGVDATDFESVKQVFDDQVFDVAINCIGLIKQRGSYVNDKEMMQINAEFPHQLAELANQNAAKMIHISTDCVFSGSKGNYCETDEPDPVDAYGRSKLLGELNDTKNLTLRTSHIGRELSIKRSFIEWLLSQRGKQVNGFSHAIYSGLTTRELSKVIAQLIASNLSVYGLSHVSSSSISKLEIINKLNQLLDLRIVVTPDASLQIDRSLNSQKFQTMTGIVPTNWDRMLSEFCQDQETYE